MISEYTVVHGIYESPISTVKYKKKLEDEVDRLIKDGWQPYGPLASSSVGDTVVFLQPTVRTDTASTGVGEGVTRQVDKGYFG